jgi:hypothetical protein
VIHFTCPIKRVAVKPLLVMILTNVIVKCKELAFAVPIVLVDVVSVKKQPKT